MARTLRGKAALEAIVEYLAPTNGDWGPPDALRGRTRADYANHQAISSFLAELRAKGSRRIYLESGEALPLSQARFRPIKGDPETDDEGTIGFGSSRISIDGIRIRMSAPGVLEMADRWGDSCTFGTSADAQFEETLWETDEWDLSEPVPPLAIDQNQVEAFRFQSSEMAASLFETRVTDRAHAEAAIRAHYANVGLIGAVPPTVNWFDGPNAAIEALGRDGSGGVGLTKSLRDRAVLQFEREITARLQGRRGALHEQVWQMVSRDIGADTLGAILRLVTDRRVQQAFGYLGLIAHYKHLAWYEFLRVSGVVLPDVIRSFCTMTAETWLLFPARDKVFAVERPVGIEAAGRSRVLLFANGDRLMFPER